MKETVTPTSKDHRMTVRVTPTSKDHRMTERVTPTLRPQNDGDSDPNP